MVTKKNHFDSKLKHGYDHAELYKLIRTVVDDSYDAFILKVKIQEFIGYTCEPPTQGMIDKWIEEYDNPVKRAEFRAKIQ